jgi:hypothetical protein
VIVTPAVNAAPLVSVTAMLDGRKLGFQAGSGMIGAGGR